MWKKIYLHRNDDLNPSNWTCFIFHEGLHWICCVSPHPWSIHSGQCFPHTVRVAGVVSFDLNIVSLLTLLHAKSFLVTVTAVNSITKYLTKISILSICESGSKVNKLAIYVCQYIFSV